MRLAGQIRLGYYPTPQSLMNCLVTGFVPPIPTATHPDPSWTAFDPFCGTGEALEAFHAPFSAGVDVDHGRLTEAATRLTLTLEADAMTLKPRSHHVSVLLLNPPYDTDPISRERLETLAFTAFLPWIHARGWLIYILPRSTFQRDLPTLDERLWIHHVWRFPDPEYEAYQQVIVIAQPRQLQDPPNAWGQFLKLDRPADAQTFNQTKVYHTFYRSPSDHFGPRCHEGWLRPLPNALAPHWRLPSTLPFTLDSLAPTSAQLLAALARTDPWNALRSQTLPQPTLTPEQALHTPLTLHRGHMATLLTAGLLTGAIGEADHRHLVKGRIVPYTVVTESTETKQVQESRFAVELHTLHPDGTLQSWHHDLSQPAIQDGSDLCEES